MLLLRGQTANGDRESATSSAVCGCAGGFCGHLHGHEQLDGALGHQPGAGGRAGRQAAGHRGGGGGDRAGRGKPAPSRSRRRRQSPLEGGVRPPAQSGRPRICGRGLDHSPRATDLFRRRHSARGRSGHRSAPILYGDCFDRVGRRPSDHRDLRPHFFRLRPEWTLGGRIGDLDCVRRLGRSLLQVRFRAAGGLRRGAGRAHARGLPCSAGQFAEVGPFRCSDRGRALGSRGHRPRHPHRRASGAAQQGGAPHPAGADHPSGRGGGGRRDRPSLAGHGTHAPGNHSAGRATPAHARSGRSRNPQSSWRTEALLGHRRRQRRSEGTGPALPKDPGGSGCPQRHHHGLPGIRSSASAAADAARHPGTAQGGGGAGRDRAPVEGREPRSRPARCAAGGGGGFRTGQAHGSEPVAQRGRSR